MVPSDSAWLDPSTAASTHTLMPPGAHAIAALGPACEALMINLFGTSPPTFLLELNRDDEVQEALKELARGFEDGNWQEESSIKVIEAYFDELRQGNNVDPSSVRRWVLSHPNNPDAVRDCIRVRPPEEITILRLLSRAGSQKLVFLSSWQLTQRQVVLKQLLGPIDQVNKTVDRESHAHPLSISHRNIIETHILRNAPGEVFLAEEYLPEILNDQWRAPGVEEAANLVYDIANALHFLHETLGLVHGDVKPDNIGIRNNSYVLLDFGICRPSSDFAPDTTATGSIRTRAPELLSNDSYESPDKADVWALAASVFNAIVGRYPLFDYDEDIPRISTPQKRAELERSLALRVSDQWDQRVDLSKIEFSALREVLSVALKRDPRDRCSAMELIDRAQRYLSTFLRKASQDNHFSPIEELHQLTTFLPTDLDDLMPATARQDLASRLRELRNYPGWTADQQQTIESLLGRVRQRLAHA